MQFTQTQDLNKTIWITKDFAQKNRDRYRIDAAWKSIWRVADIVAFRLMWKHKPHYCEFFDMWACVIIENIDKVTRTWRKGIDKIYYRHSGYKGNLKEISLESQMKKDPLFVLEHAVNGMLPKNKHRSNRMKRLKLHVWVTTKYDNLSPQTLDG